MEVSTSGLGSKSQLIHFSLFIKSIQILGGWRVNKSQLVLHTELTGALVAVV